jgi:excisionase family DNA binding protein
MLSTSDLAKHLGVHEQTVRALVRDGLPHLRVGRVLRFENAEVVKRWLSKQRKSTPGKSAEEAAGKEAA